jgi:hypothetical protein
MARMAVAGAGAFATPTAPRVGVGLGIHRNHAGRCGGARPALTAGGLPLQFGDALRRSEQRQRDGFAAQRVQRPRRGLIADAGLQRRHHSSASERVAVLRMPMTYARARSRRKG